MSDQNSLFQEPGSGNPAGAAPDAPVTPFSERRPAGPDLGAELKAIQRQLSNLMIVLLVVSGTLAIFLLQEVRYAKADFANLRSQSEQLDEARQVIANYNQKSVPAMQGFLSQLGEYAKTHPDVLPILAKYGLARRNPEGAGAAPAPRP
jgi:hypothetical protein